MLLVAFPQRASKCSRILRPNSDPQRDASIDFR